MCPRYERTPQTRPADKRGSYGYGNDGGRDGHDEVGGADSGLARQGGGKSGAGDNRAEKEHPARDTDAGLEFCGCAALALADEQRGQEPAHPAVGHES
jgi:hypothetical protein